MPFVGFLSLRWYKGKPTIPPEGKVRGLVVKLVREAERRFDSCRTNWSEIRELVASTPAGV